MPTRSRLQPLNPVATRPELYESLWILARRLMAANELRPHEFLKHFARPRSTCRQSVFWNVYQRLNLETLAPYVELSPESIRAVVPAQFELCRPLRPLGPIKLCPDCAAIGYHSVLHDVQWIERCPIHGRRLFTNCPRCGRFLSHTSAKRFGQSPWTLPCGHTWTNAEISRPPDIDTMAIRKQVTWLRRVRSTHSGERWFAVALGHSRGLQVPDDEYKEILDLFVGITECCESIQALANESLWSTGHVAAWTHETLRPDWFESSLQRCRRISVAVCRPEYWRDYYAQRTNEAIGFLSSLGRRKLVSTIRRTVYAVDFSTGDPVRLPLDSSTAELLAAVFMIKHSRSTATHRFDAGDASSYLRFAMHKSGQPLGILHTSAVRPTFYWLTS